MSEERQLTRGGGDIAAITAVHTRCSTKGTLEAFHLAKYRFQMEQGHAIAKNLNLRRILLTRQAFGVFQEAFTHSLAISKK